MNYDVIHQAVEIILGDAPDSGSLSGGLFILGKSRLNGENLNDTAKRIVDSLSEVVENAGKGNPYRAKDGKFTFGTGSGLSKSPTAEEVNNYNKEINGGPGSGHHGHSGRPGQRGGSGNGTFSSINSKSKAVQDKYAEFYSLKDEADAMSEKQFGLDSNSEEFKALSSKHESNTNEQYKKLDEIIEARAELKKDVDSYFTSEGVEPTSIQEKIRNWGAGEWMSGIGPKLDVKPTSSVFTDSEMTAMKKLNTELYKKPITAYRGMSVTESTSEVTFRKGEIASFSESKKAASGFGRGKFDSRSKGTVISTTISPSDIIISHKWGSAYSAEVAANVEIAVSFPKETTVKIQNALDTEDNGYNPYRDLKTGRFAPGPRKSEDSNSKFHVVGDSFKATEKLGSDYKVSDEVREAHYGDIADYAGGGYDSVNSLLRKGVDKKSLEDGMTADVIYSLDDAFAGGYQKLKSDTTVFRGMRLTKPVKVGQTIQNKGFMSTSTETGIPRTFARPQSDSETGYLLRIRAKKRTPVIVPKGYDVGSPLEAEIIFNRKSKLKIKSITTEADTGLKLMEADYVQ